jgi:hypothetical protein
MMVVFKRPMAAGKWKRKLLAGWLGGVAAFYFVK